MIRATTSVDMARAKSPVLLTGQKRKFGDKDRAEKQAEKKARDARDDGLYELGAELAKWSCKTGPCDPKNLELGEDFTLVHMPKIWAPSTAVELPIKAIADLGELGEFHDLGGKDRTLTGRTGLKQEIKEKYKLEIYELPQRIRYFITQLEVLEKKAIAAGCDESLPAGVWKFPLEGKDEEDGAESEDGEEDGVEDGEEDAEGGNDSKA